MCSAIRAKPRPWRAHTAQTSTPGAHRTQQDAVRADTLGGLAWRPRCIYASMCLLRILCTRSQADARMQGLHPYVHAHKARKYNLRSLYICVCRSAVGRVSICCRAGQHRAMCPFSHCLLILSCAGPACCREEVPSRSFLEGFRLLGGRLPCVECGSWPALSAKGLR